MTSPKQHQWYNFEIQIFQVHDQQLRKKNGDGGVGNVDAIIACAMAVIHTYCVIASTEGVTVGAVVV